MAAAEAKKGGVKHHVKSISAPATPQRPGSGTPKHRIGATEHEKPIPSYLRPTISSCRNTSRQSPPPPATTTTKSLVTKKPKAPSSSQLKERTPKPSSPLPKPSKAKSPMLSKSQSFSRATTRTKRIEAKQHQVAPPTLLESKSFSGVTATSTKKKYANREDRRVLPTLAEAAELKNQLGTISKRKPEVAREVNSNEEKMTGATRVVRQAGGHEGKRVVLKRRESSQPYNEVIEETANKLAERRRNKVLALVGAFETVISLQELEGQPSPKVDSRKKEKEREEEEVDKLDCGSDDREGEKTNVNVGGIVDQDMEENNVDDDRTQIRIRTDEKNEVQGDEEQQQEETEDEKKVENETESTKSTTGVEECYRVGHESQQQREEMESTESTEELTESTKEDLTESTTEEGKGSELTVHATEEEKNAEECKLEV